MQELTQAEIDHHAKREGTDTRVLVWIEAKNRATGATETMGLWTGDDHEDFTIGGQVRTYFAAGNVLNVDNIISEIGLNVRMHNITLSAISPEIEQLVRGYDVRLAPVEIHRVVRDLETGNLISAPRQIFKG